MQLCVTGTILFALAAAAPWIVRSFGYKVFIPLLAASGLVTIVATRLAADVPVRTGLIVVLGLALAMRLVLVVIDPLLSTDLYRYVWDGRVQAAGINPYAHVPADPALTALRDAAIYPRINRADYAVTAYPPVAQMFFLAVTRISESVVAMRLAMIGCEVAIVAAIIALLRRLALPETAVVAYAWHPLAVFEIANNGHVEALMVALMMLGVWLLVSERKVAGAVAVALAALAKPYAVLILPAFWRPWDWRVPLAVAAAALACYLPYLGAGWGVFGFLTGTSRRKGSPPARGSGLSRSRRRCSATCRGSRLSMLSWRPASWLGSACASRSGRRVRRARRSPISFCCSPPDCS